MLDSIIQGSNCELMQQKTALTCPLNNALPLVDRDEVDRLRKRFMKLDKVRLSPLDVHQFFRMTCT